MSAPPDRRTATARRYDEFLLPAVTRGIEPIEIASASGRTLVASDGRRYLDCYSGISVVNAGHNHPRIIAAAREQMERLVHCCSYLYHVPVVGELAEALAAVTPGDLRQSFLCNSGAEAIEGALRLAKQATGRREVVALGYGFHGRTLAALSITGNAARKRGNGPYTSGVAFAPAPYCYRCPLGLKPDSCGTACAHALKDVVRQQTSGDVAAFVAEPILGEGGILVPPPEYLGIATAIMHDAGALFIADEVQSGFGRSGTMFAVERTGTQPDILVMAKGIAGGFPLGAFIASERVAAAMQPGDHLSTFGGNPVSCAAALANLAVIRDERLAENAAARGADLMSRLRTLQERTSTIGDVRGCGLMIGLELVADRATKEPAPEAARAARLALRERGLLLGVGGVFGNVLRLQPPLSITAEECDAVVDALTAALS